MGYLHSNAVRCSALQRVAVRCSVLQCILLLWVISIRIFYGEFSQTKSLCCSVLQCVAASCSVLPCVAVCSSVLRNKVKQDVCAAV